MNDPFVSLPEIKKDMRELRDLGKELGRRLALLERLLIHIFSQIKKCENFEQAQEYLASLSEIQSSLLTLISRDCIDLNQRLNAFIYEFERWGSNEKNYFEGVRSGEYTF